MGKFALILVAWYSIMSEPEGSWKYVQVFGWFNDKAQCAQRAMDEASNAKKFNSYFRSYFPLPQMRRMVITKMTAECLTYAEFTERAREGNLR